MRQYECDGFSYRYSRQGAQEIKNAEGRFHVGSAGVEAMNIACATSDYLMHSKLTYWDSVPVVMVMQALGHHVRLAPGGLPYQPGDKGVLLAAPSAVIWQELADFVYCLNKGSIFFSFLAASHRLSIFSRPASSIGIFCSASAFSM